MPYAAVNGLKMYYEVHGDGPPLLLLHGGTGSIPATWLPYFEPRFRVVAMEQMGHGRTADAMDRSFHYHDMAEDTTELIRQLQIESAVIVGDSDGGIIGLDIAIHHPERLTRLVLTGVNGRTKRQDRLLRHDPVPGAWDHTELRIGDRPEHLDGVLCCDDVAVADDDQRRRPDALQLVVREAWFCDPHGLEAAEDDGPVARAVGRQAAKMATLSRIRSGRGPSIPIISQLDG